MLLQCQARCHCNGKRVATLLGTASYVAAIKPCKQRHNAPRTHHHWYWPTEEYAAEPEPRYDELLVGTLFSAAPAPYLGPKPRARRVAAHADATAGPPPKKRAYTKTPTPAAPSTPKMTPAATAPPSTGGEDGPAADVGGGVVQRGPVQPPEQVHVPVPVRVPLPEQAPFGPQAGQAEQAAPQNPSAHVSHDTPPQPVAHAPQ